MRRVALVIALLAAIALPGVVTAGSSGCSLVITPPAGSPTDVYRFSVSDVPVDANGGSIEVRTVIRKLGTREGSVIFAFLIPGVTEFYVDYHVGEPGEPAPDPLSAGRYQVVVSTPHLSGPDGCHTVGQFVVR